MSYALLGFAGCDAINSYLNPPPDIKFAPAGKAYSEKPDFARVEQEFPLAVAELEKLTPANLKNFSQEQLDQIYARLTAGPIPDGPFDGDLIFPRRARRATAGSPRSSAGCRASRSS